MRAEVRWEPVSYPYSYSSEATTWRRARHIVLAEQLQVLRLNLNGMLEGAGGLLAAAGTLTIIPGAIVIYFVRNYIAKGFALGRV